MLVFNELIAKAVSLHASDLHITAGIPPTVRVDGELHPLGEDRCLPADIEAMAMSILAARLKFSSTARFFFCTRYSNPAIHTAAIPATARGIQSPPPPGAALPT